IKFWLNGSNSGDFIVGVMTDPNDASTFVSVDTVNQMGSVYTQVAISFSSYTGSAKYVAFKHGMSGTYKSFYVDDIELYEPLPNEMMMLSWDAPMSSIDYASGDVVVSVYNNGIAAQSSIPVAYSTDGGTTIVYDIITATVYPGDTLQFTFATPAVFASGLHECGAVVNNGDAVPENDTAFYTMVNHSMPFYDDFENYSEDQIDLGIPNGYAGLNTLSSTSADVSLFYADYNAYSGSNSMRIYNSSTTSGVLLFTIPYYGGTSLVDKWLTFWHKGYSNVDLIIGVMDAYDDTASFVAMDTIRPVDSEYYKYAVLLSPYAGTGKYIAFKHGLNSTYKSLYIDDIRFEIAPTSSVLHISADSLVFRGARLGIDTSIQKYIIENKGVGQIIVSAPSVGGTNAFSFVIIDTNTYPKSLGMLESLEVTIGLSDSQVGEKEAFVHFSSDGVSDTIQLMGEVVDSIIQTFPFVENFNSGLLDMGWRIDAVSYEGNGDYVWLFNQGSTPRLYTGPSHDLSGNGNYLFVDAQLGYSDSYGADETTLSTIQIDFSTLSEPRLNFWYHMYGADVHVLKVFVFQNGSYSLVQSIIGEQQTSSADDWLMSSIDLSSYSGIIDSITFQTIYDGPLGDVAIDNIAFGENMLIDLGADTAVCSTAITSVVLDAGSGNSSWKYRWKELSSSNILDTLQTYTVVSPGTYIVEAMDDGYFFGSDTIVVLFNSYPTV
ncbi:MAG: hypothetical protein KAH32_08790, partial [Chlamydiia bacterium]|nr:hypothetical protein [Chlamydiia bacterium]